MPRKDPTDNWFNNGANRLWKTHPVVFVGLCVAGMALIFYLRLR